MVTNIKITNLGFFDSLSSSVETGFLLISFKLGVAPTESIIILLLT